ncbi:MAG: gluconokinase [Burkholderiales bacterium]
MIVVLMGASGCGKTTVGRLLAQRLDCEFIDADDFHPPANVAKMTAGIALEDADRWPWLERLNAELRRREVRAVRAVLACSALRQTYRDRLWAGLAHCELVYLRASAELLRERLSGRQHRYMPASLLASQLATLEPPARAIEIDAAQPPERCVELIAAAIGAVP